MESSHNASPIVWHTEILPPDTLRALYFLATQDWLQKSDWYLAGGTALALHAGHRQSVDLDFFSPLGTFAIEPLLEEFRDSQWVTDIAEKGTVYGHLLNAKVSFIAYPFFKPSKPSLWYGAVHTLTPADIAVMKIIAVSQRGRKRDF